MNFSSRGFVLTALSLSLSLLPISGCGRKGLSSSSGGTPVPSAPASPLPTAALTFPDGKTITVDLAATPDSREYGLMNRTSLPEDYGMLFVFADERGVQFWMKNTLVDLDMVFIGKDKKITEVFKDVPRSAPDTPEVNLARRSGLAQYVLELPEGAAERHKLEGGQQFVFSVPIPSN